MSNEQVWHVGWVLHNACNIEKRLINDVMAKCATCDDAIALLQKAQDEAYIVPTRLYCPADVEEYGMDGLHIESRDVRGEIHFIALCEIKDTDSEHTIKEPSWGCHIREWLEDRFPDCRVDWCVYVCERYVCER